MSSRPRIVIDTDVVVSAVFFAGASTRTTLEKATKVGIVLASDATIEELFSLLKRPRLARLNSAHRHEVLVREYALRCEIVAVYSTVHASRNPRDNKFLELALDGRADLILTGDNDLLSLHPFRGIPILSPTQYLEMNA